MAHFVLVAGGGHGPWCWERLAPELEARGHRVTAPDVPSSVPDAGLADYADATAGAIDRGPDLVLVGHSMAGAYLPLIAGRTGATRQVFLCAYVPVAGQAVFPADMDAYETQGGGTPSIEVDELGRLPMDRYGPETAKAVLCGDCDDDTVAWLAARLRPQGVAVMTEPFPDDGWPAGVRSAFICCDDDPVQLVETARAQSAPFGVEPLVLPGSHSPFLSRPAELADALVALLDDESRWGELPPR